MSIAVIATDNRDWDYLIIISDVLSISRYWTNILGKRLNLSLAIGYCVQGSKVDIPVT